MEDKKEISVSKKIGRIEAEAIHIDQILLWSGEDQERLKAELENIHSYAFTKMPREQRKVYVADYFRRPGQNFHRETILFRNETKRLIGTTIFDRGAVLYDSTAMEGIYLISHTVLPEYQGFGLGKVQATKVLVDFQPDVLFVTCAQSASLHSWVRLCQQGQITGFEVYPRLEQKNGRDVLITVPFKDLDFAINAFKQTYLGVVEGDQQKVEQATRNLTVHMVRKDIYGEMYDFDPWQKNGREDKFANALDLSNTDGVLVMFRKNWKI